MRTPGIFPGRTQVSPSVETCTRPVMTPFSSSSSMLVPVNGPKTRALSVRTQN